MYILFFFIKQNKIQALPAMGGFGDDRLSLKEKVGQLFIYTIAPVDTKANQALLREAVDTYKVGGLLIFRWKNANNKLSSPIRRNVWHVFR